MKRKFVAFLLVLATFAMPRLAFAAATECTGVITATTIPGDVVVPSGAFCDLDGVIVQGDVIVQRGGSLSVDATSTDTLIRGNIRGNGCGYIQLKNTASPAIRMVVGGDVTIARCTDTAFSGCVGVSTSTPPASVLIGGSFKCSDISDTCVALYCTVAGDVDCSGNAGGCELAASAVGGNAIINDNGALSTIANNVIAGALKCNGNAAANGAGNKVAGTKSGQCSGF
jgi:hypothetical protein